MTLGSKLEVLALMIRGAHHLSGMAVEKSPSSLLLKSTPQPQSPIEILDDVQSTSVSESKTIVKRPLRLASLSKKTIYFRNNFPLCAEAFFSIVFKSLHDSLSEIFSARDLNDSDPGIHILYPAQSLLALGSFTRCAINTPLQKKFATALLPFAFQLRHVPSLHIRRGAMMALVDATESLIHCFNSHHQHRSQLSAPEHAFGTLDYALNILRDDDQFSHTLPPILIEIIDWVSVKIHEEVDPDCRIYQLEILRLALSCLESSNAS